MYNISKKYSLDCTKNSIQERVVLRYQAQPLQYVRVVELLYYV